MRDIRRKQRDALFVFRVLSLMSVGIAFCVWDSVPSVANAQPSEGKSQEQRAETMTKIRITISGKQLTAAIEDNAAAKDFLSLLPMTLTLKDYNNTEKVSDLPTRLSTEGTPDGLDPEAGDITYYAPWGNLAIFYRDFGYASGLVRLGKIESGIEMLQQKGPFKVVIERTE